MPERNLARFEGDTVIVTGSTRGIGEATAERFAEEGASVVVTGRSVDDGKAVAERIRSDGGEATFVRTDLADPEEVQTMIDEAVDAYGSVDVLVNNAAVQTNETVQDATLETWALEIDVNFRAYWLSVKYALEHMPRGASVVNVSSNHAFLTMPGTFPYNAIKAGINGMTRAMALELGPDVRVNTVNPGWTVVRETDDPDVLARRAEIAELHPLDRMGQPEDVAGVITFLASDDAAFVTGSAFLVDGGRAAVMQDDSFLNYKRDS